MNFFDHRSHAKRAKIRNDITSGVGRVSLRGSWLLEVHQLERLVSSKEYFSFVVLSSNIFLNGMHYSRI